MDHSNIYFPWNVLGKIITSTSNLVNAQFSFDVLFLIIEHARRDDPRGASEVVAEASEFGDDKPVPGS